MRRLLPLAFVGMLAVPASAEYTKYSEFRAESPIVDETVALLSSSDIHGTFNRISALNLRSAIRDLEDGSDPADLPANYVRGMKSAIEDLDEDLASADADLTALSCIEAPNEEDCLDADDLILRKWVLVQTVHFMLAERLNELNRAGDLFGCSCDDCVFPGDATWSCFPTAAGSAELTMSMQSLIAGPNTLGQWLIDIIDNAENGGQTAWCDNSGMTPQDCSSGTHANNIAGRVDELHAVHGEPIIDSRVTGVPSIDP